MAAASFLDKFRRVTKSTAYMPEIDGLRFLAIFLVVAFMHIPNYLNEKFYNGKLLPTKQLHDFILEGGHGVSLFFAISGFILSLPFAKARLSHASPVSLRNYYLRRLVRLEPPYILALTIFFVAHVFILKQYPFDALLKSYGYSLGYLHTLLLDSKSLILPIAWSLEVEVQFYLLAPFFCLLFAIKQAVLRRLLCSVIILVFTIYWFDDWSTPHLLKYLHFFFCGILLADLYLAKVRIIKNDKPASAAGVLSLAGFLFIPSTLLWLFCLKLFCMLFLFYSVFSNTAMRNLFSIKLIAIIGGMCYSIYLLHFAIISLAGRWMLKWGINENLWMAIVYGLFLLGLTVVISALYFLWVEKPFMKMQLPSRKKQTRKELLEVSN